jgi:putative ATP-grasp target RiPP
MSLTPLLPPTLVEDPLVAVGERFPLAWPRFGQPESAAEAASPAGVRPFGLRFTVEPSAPAASLPQWRYDVDRQIAVDTDGQPWHRQLVDMTMQTTGPHPDGTGSTGNEEWTPDDVPDEDDEVSDERV